MHEIACDICGSSETQILFNKGRNNEHVTNVICQKCGLVFVSPRQEKKEVTAQYLEGDFSLAARGNYKPSPQKFTQSEQTALRRFRTFIQVVKEDTQPGRCLEIGCGVGSFLRLMQGAGWQVQGIEPDPYYAEAGSLAYGIPVSAQLYEEIVYTPNSFNLITTFHVLEHVLSPKTFLSKIHQELADNGFLFVEVPCIDKPYGGNLSRFFWSAHLYSFSQNTLTGLLQQVGFQVIWTGFVGDFLQVIAQKGLPSTVSFPLDDPDLRYRRVHNSHRLYRMRQQNPVGNLIYKVGFAASHGMTTAQKDPAEFVAGVYRRARRLQVEVLSARLQKAETLIHHPKYLAHFGMHVPGNAGDTMLFTAVRDIIDFVNGRSRWSLEPLWAEVNAQTVHRLNEQFKGVVIGGGGLLLRDTNPNANSGWQWNCPTTQLQSIHIPIIVFAIGYNRFRGQDDFDSIFAENIRQLVTQSAFFGLRNRGSIAALSGYLEPAQAQKLVFQPCPTTMLRYFYPAYEGFPFQDGIRRLALNTAFDRHHSRFAGKEDEILTALARAMKWAAANGWEIHLAIHRKDDASVIPWLIREHVPFTEVILDGRPVSQILSFYQRMPLTIGMRGHSQMIPFGLGNSIISLVSHDKLRYFLDDIEHPEWGIDVQDPQLTDRLVASIQYTETHIRTIQTHIWQAQQALWETTTRNLQAIQKVLTS